MKMITSLFAALFLFVGATGALAGGLQLSEHQKHNYVTQWTGAYIGGNGSITSPTVNIDGLDLENRHYSLGVHAGFDQLFFGRIFAGVRASYSWKIDDVNDYTNAQHSWDVIGRAGPLVTRNLAFYGLGGFGVIENEGEDFYNWKVGIGAQYYMTDRISIFAEHQWLLADDDFDPIKDATVDGSHFLIGGSIKIGSF